MGYFQRRLLCGLWVATGLALLLAFAQPASADNPNICYLLIGPPRCSALDCPLRPYFMPRRAAWGGSEYRYSLKTPEPFCACDAACGCGNDGPCVAGACSIPPEAAEGFDPWEFEVLGQIPNDFLLESVAPAASL